jgi:integrase
MGREVKSINLNWPLAGKGIVIKKRKTFRELAREYAKPRAGSLSYEKSQKYFIGYLDENKEWKDMSLTEHFADWKISQITSHEIEIFRKERKEALANGKERSIVSVNRELEILRHMLSNAIEWGWLDYNPFYKFINAEGKSSIFYEEVGRDRFLTRDEISKFLEAPPPYLETSS